MFFLISHPFMMIMDLHKFISLSSLNYYDFLEKFSGVFSNCLLSSFRVFSFSRLHSIEYERILLFGFHRWLHFSAIKKNVPHAQNMNAHMCFSFSQVANETDLSSNIFFFILERKQENFDKKNVASSCDVMILPPKECYFI